MIETALQILGSNLMELSRYLIDPNKRIFGLYLLSALLLAIPIYIKTASNKQWRGFLSFVFPKAIYTAPSAKQDYALLVINKLIKAILITPVVITMVPIALGTSNLLEVIFGTLTPLSWPVTYITICFTLLLFLMDDLTRFLLHLALHKIPFLWDFHKVHHSAKVLTPFTIYRSHPIENFLYATRMAISQGIAVGIGYYVFGPTLNMFDVLGANLFVFLFNLFGSNLRHSHIWLSWGDKLEAWLISPAQHQIHHSDNPDHFDKNLGSALAIWDKLLGTLIKASQVQHITFGIGNDDPKHNSLWNIYTQPFIQVFQRLTQRVSKHSKTN